MRLLRRKVFSWNGVFYGSIIFWLWYVFIKRNLLLAMVWMLNKHWDRLDAKAKK